MKRSPEGVKKLLITLLLVLTCEKDVMNWDLDMALQDYSLRDLMKACI